MWKKEISEVFPFNALNVVRSKICIFKRLVQKGGNGNLGQNMLSIYRYFIFKVANNVIWKQVYSSDIDIFFSLSLINFFHNILFDRYPKVMSFLKVEEYYKDKINRSNFLGPGLSTSRFSIKYLQVNDKKLQRSLETYNIHIQKAEHRIKVLFHLFGPYELHVRQFSRAKTKKTITLCTPAKSILQI